MTLHTTLGVWMDPERGGIMIEPEMDKADMWLVLQWALQELEVKRDNPPMDLLKSARP